MSSTFHLLCPRYNGPLIPMLLGHGKTLPLTTVIILIEPQTRAGNKDNSEIISQYNIYSDLNKTISVRWF